MKNILYIVPSNYDDLSKKGVLNIIKERDEGAYFDNVLTLHPLTRDNTEIQINKNNILVEYGWKSSIKKLNHYKITKLVGIFLILYKLFFIFPFKIKKYNINIIRATDPYYMGLLGLFYSKIFNIPLAVSIHSDYDKRYLLDGSKGSFTILKSRYLAKKLEGIVYRFCDKIIPIREYMKRNIIKEFRVKSEKVDVFPHGISFDEFDSMDNIDIKKRFHIDENVYIISFVGRISKENYVYDIIKVAKQLKITRRDFVILVAGDGDEFVSLQNIIKEQKLSDFIKMLGFQDKKTVVNIRKQSVVSLCFMAGFSLIEACASAKPIISYDVEWHYELVKNNKTGFLIKECDIIDMTAKINLLLDNPELASSLGKNARNIAYQKHDIKNTILIKQNIYKSIIGF